MVFPRTSKSAWLEKILDYIEKRGTITNDRVQLLTGVSDTTATRYLQELETQAKIRQIGAQGKNSHYEYLPPPN